MSRKFADWLLLLLCAAALAAAVLIGLHWPLVGDSALMHYVVWLTRHGFAPYRQIAEMNLPLAYMSEQAAMGLFGAGDAGWRWYDGALSVALVLLCWRLLRRNGPAPGVFAGTLFVAVHLQDGIHMAGQRDLLVTVLQAGAGLALLRSFGPAPAEASRESSVAVTAAFAALAGALGMAGACIKPPAFLFLIAVWAWRVVTGDSGRDRLAATAGAVVGALVPVLGCLLYLRHFGAVAAFLQNLHGLVAYHASIERRSIGFLLGHAWSPVVPFVLVTAAVLLWAGRRAAWTRVDTLCAIGVVAGVLSYVVQGKGFPYQRYPLLLWLLLLCASRVWAALRQPGTPARAWVALYSPVATGLVLTVVFLVRSTHFSNADPYAALRLDLRARDAGMDGAVQCLDTAGPCIGALYKERLTQSTGFLYDCYLLDGTRPVVQQQRALFQREWAARPPRLIVMTDSNCFTGPRTFAKYTSWPWMQQQLAEYQVILERHPAELLRLWSRAEKPYAYRILVKR